MFSYPKLVGQTVTRVIQSGHEGPAAVFVHGTGARADRWIRNLESVAGAGFRAYAIDLPGHGLAAKDPGFNHSVPAYAEFLGQFLDGFGSEKVSLIGTSLGGHVAATCTIGRPERIERLMLVGSMGLVPVGEETRLRIQAGAANQTREAIIQKLHRVIADSSLITDELIEEEFAVNNSTGAAGSFQRLGCYIARHLDADVVGDRLNSLPSDIPIQLVWGTEDKTVAPAVGAKAHQLIKRSRLSLIEGAAHTCYFEKPDEFNQQLTTFIGDSRGSMRAAAPASLSRGSSPS
jgi:pimeloyl-ACP methyl ester carboxylesterase